MDHKAATSFQQFKDDLTIALVLKLSNFSSSLTIENDASGTRIRVVLMQNGQPIAYYSEALKGSTLTLSTYEKEMLVVVKLVRKWWPYLLGNSFTV